MSYLGLKWHPFLWVLHSVQIYRVLIGKGEKYVHVFNGLLASLLIAENEINPVIDVFWRIITLQLFSYCGDEFVRISCRPFRQLYVVNSAFILGESKVVIINIQKHFRKSVNLGYKLPDVCWGKGGILPWSNITAKDSISTVKFTTLKSQRANRKGSYSDEIVENNGTWRVMCTEMILIEQLLFIIRWILLKKMLFSLLSTVTAHIFHEISVIFFLFFLIFCICYEHPRKNWILGDIEKVSSSDVVQPLYVLKVAHLFLYPFEGLFRI